MEIYLDEELIDIYDSVSEHILFSGAYKNLVWQIKLQGDKDNN